jgi:hypothetical protein
VAFLRFTRDRRGYEHTFLLHAARPGEEPIVLYWYRSAPGVRVGRPALDEDAIRTIEEQHPDVDFDWPHILEVGAVTETEVEKPVRPRRKLSAPQREQPPASERAPQEPPVPVEAGRASAPDAPELADVVENDTAPGEEEGAQEPRPHDLLEELVGHEIATRLHARYSEIIARVHRLPEGDPRRAAFEARAEALNPDNWVTPGEVLHGVQHADAVFDSLRKELLAH